MTNALVGRVELLELWPFSQGELAGAPERFVDRLFDAPRELVRSGGLDRRQLIDRILAGGFPEAVGRPPSRRRTWFDSYVAVATQSVIREIAAIERLAEIPRLLRICAARTGTELNVSAIASDFGVPARTADGYLTLLATAFLIDLVPAWSANLSSKVVRRPKLVLADSGLAAHLVQATRTSVDQPRGPLGQLLETFVNSRGRTNGHPCGISATAAESRWTWSSSTRMDGSSALRSRRRVRRRPRTCEVCAFSPTGSATAFSSVSC